MPLPPLAYAAIREARRNAWAYAGGLYLGALIVMALAGVVLGGCASTTVAYGPFRYQSDKDVSARNVTYERKADGSEKFHADSLGGDASTVDAVQAAALIKLGKMVSEHAEAITPAGALAPLVPGGK